MDFVADVGFSVSRLGGLRFLGQVRMWRVRNANFLGVRGGKKTKWRGEAYPRQQNMANCFDFASSHRKN